ncbi:MAG: DUF4129 domain-containing protein [Calditrichia bacterium]
MKNVLLITAFICSINALLAAESSWISEIAIDSSLTEIQQFDLETLREFREDSDFFYDHQPPNTIGWWEDFKRWLWHNIFRSLGVVDNPFLRNLLFYGFIAAVLGYAAYKMSEGDIQKLWKGRSRKVTVDFLEDEKDIQDLDIEKLLKQALQENDLHRATRLLYLKALRQLSERALILWQRDKTNSDYILELSGNPIQDNFREITRIFDHVYYGDFKLRIASFPELRAHFEQFYERLGALK